MTPKMPRGAIPTLRSELAASEPYRPEAAAEIFVPSGEFPTPNGRVAARDSRQTGMDPRLAIRFDEAADLATLEVYNTGIDRLSTT